MTQTTDEAAQIIAELLTYLDDWQKHNMSGVAKAIAWLRKVDHPDLFLRVSVRDMMEASST